MDVPFAAITRSLEMQLDQLYYWARRVTERRSEGSDAEVAQRMLDLASENLQRFLTTLLDCFRAIELAPTTISVSQLVADLARYARDECGAGSVIVSGGAGETLLVDQGRLARVWSGILRRLGMPGTPGSVHVTAAPTVRDGERGVEISIRQNGPGRPSGATDALADLEWELARRIVRLHGGQLTLQDASRERAVVVFLPAR